MPPAIARRFITIPTIIAGLVFAYVLSLSVAVARQHSGPFAGRAAHPPAVQGK